MQATAFFLADAFSSSQTVLPAPEAPELVEENGVLYVSTLEGRECAKGFLWALCLQAGAAFLLYGAWHFAHILLS
jgi:hypothetical protein